jgi:hypothetical protein
MKLKQYKDTFYEFSGKASDISRQLAFAGIAVIWIFRLSAAPPKIPDELLFPLFLLVIALLFDIAQYGIATIIWGVFQWKKEKDLQKTHKDINLADLDELELDHPSWMKIPQLVCFSIKMVSMVIAYVLLALYLYHIWT